nr:hypothetical protein [Corynebacterium lactis]
MPAPAAPSPSPISPALAVLSRLVRDGHRPAALIGNWFGHRAVIAADVALSPAEPSALFAAGPGAPGQWVFGQRPYSGPAAQGSRPASRCLPTTALGRWPARNRR